MGYIKERSFVPPLPVSLNELNQHITIAVPSVDKDMLRSVWTELDYRIDIQGVTGGTDQTSGECSLGQTIPI